MTHPTSSANPPFRKKMPRDDIKGSLEAASVARCSPNSRSISFPFQTISSKQAQKGMLGRIRAMTTKASTTEGPADVWWYHQLYQYGLCVTLSVSTLPTCHSIVGRAINQD